MMRRSLLRPVFFGIHYYYATEVTVEGVLDSVNKYPLSNGMDLYLIPTEQKALGERIY